MPEGFPEGPLSPPEASPPKKHPNLKPTTTLLPLLLCLPLLLAACQQETEPPTATTPAADKGYIHLSLSADDALRTRAMQDVEDVTTWYAVVSDGTQTLYDQQISGELGARAFDPGTYSIDVRNYADADAANIARGGWGDAYHTGSASDIEVSAGGTAYVHIACGRPLNAKFPLNYSEFSGIINALTVTDPRTLTFAYADGTLAREAFFPPHSTLTYTIDYTIGTETKTTQPQTLTLGDAATVSTLRIKSDIYGTLSVSLTCDSAFEGDAQSDITIDAASGSAP